MGSTPSVVEERRWCHNLAATPHTIYMVGDSLALLGGARPAPLLVQVDQGASGASGRRTGRPWLRTSRPMSSPQWSADCAARSPTARSTVCLPCCAALGYAP